MKGINDSHQLKGGFLQFGARIYEASTFEDCIAIQTHTPSYYLVLPFRGGFIQTRITKKKYLEILNSK